MRFLLTFKLKRLKTLIKWQVAYPEFFRHRYQKPPFPHSHTRNGAFENGSKNAGVFWKVSFWKRPVSREDSENGGIFIFYLKLWWKKLGILSLPSALSGFTLDDRRKGLKNCYFFSKQKSLVGQLKTNQNASVAENTLLRFPRDEKEHSWKRIQVAGPRRPFLPSNFLQFLGSLSLHLTDFYMIVTMTRIRVIVVIAPEKFERSLNLLENTTRGKSSLSCTWLGYWGSGSASGFSYLATIGYHQELGLHSQRSHIRRAFPHFDPA